MKVRVNSNSKSRRSRDFRRRCRSIVSNQSRITQYFNVIDKLELALKRNNELRNELNKYMEMNYENVGANIETKDFLKCLLKNAFLKTEKKTGNRYIEKVKLFSAYVFMLGGRLLYETLASNLNLPSLSTVDKFIRSTGPKILEGELRVESLKEYLVAKKLAKKAPLYVWISEDATKITGRIQYDCSTNQLVGFPLPFDDNGMPKAYSFLARSAAEIEDHFQKNAPAENAYAIMAQPLSHGCPAFCLSLYGTDNKFSSSDVLRRWSYIEEQLRNSGITVLGFSSDGDPKLLKAMKIKSNLGNEIDSNDDFSLDHVSRSLDKSTFCIQDPTHIGTKLRNRLLHKKVKLTIGKGIISVEFLETLIQNVTKDKHLLTPSDLDPKDRMNFLSAKKISDPRIWILLSEHVPNSEATVIFLRLIHYMTDSFLNSDLSPLERIRRVWYCTFIVRIWRWWIKSSKDHKLSDNFISLNCYTCIELNAQEMICILKHLREHNLDDLFLLYLYSSQACEGFFRQLRSMSTVYSTVVNFSLADVLYKLKRLQFQSDIMTSRDMEEVIFPRLLKKTNLSPSKYALPSDSDINETIQNALNEAISDLQELIPVDINTKHKDFFRCDIVANSSINEYFDEYDSSDKGTDVEGSGFAEEVPEDVERDLTCLQSLQGDLNLKIFPNSQISENSKFVIVRDANKEYTIKKSSLCWLLSKGGVHLSSDRLLRVRQGVAIENKNTNSETTHENTKTVKNKPNDEVLPKKKTNFSCDDYVVVKYNERFFPGIVAELRGDEALVKVMVPCLKTSNWKWPKCEDILWYQNINIVEKIPTPVPFNRRGLYKIQEMEKYT